MAISSWHISLLLVQSMAMIVLAGNLITELFKKERKNKLDVVWLLGLVILWLIFLTIGARSVFFEGLNEILGIVAFISFIMMLVLFGILIIKRFKFFNKPLLFSEIILLIVMTITILVTSGNYSAIVIPMAIMAFISTFLGYFIVITFLIKTSRKKR